MLTRLALVEIESSRASSTVVGNWAASVQQWMTPSNEEDDQMEDGEDGGNGDIIARAKGMGHVSSFPHGGLDLIFWHPLISSFGILGRNTGSPRQGYTKV